MIYTMNTVCLFGAEAERLPLAEGEALFYTGDAAMRRTLRVLCGVSGDALPGAAVRIRICVPENGADCAEAVAASRADGAPLVWIGDAAPAGEAVVSLPRPFALDAFADAMRVLLSAEGAPLPVPEPAAAAAEPPPALVWDAANRTVSARSVSVTLSEREAAVFALLYEASPEPVPLSRLNGEFRRAGGNGAAVYISYLRRRLEKLPAAAAIHFERERGYALLFQESPREDGEDREK